MVNYRRDYTSGATYFFTVTLNNRTSSVLTTHIHVLGKAFRETRKWAPFITTSIVVLPEHLHVIWRLPVGDDDYSKRWRLIKTYFTRAVLTAGETLSKNKRGEYDLWQKRFWEHRIRNEHDLMTHINYIHYNPVKHQLVERPSDWPYSSVHRYIKNGVLPKHWCGENIEFFP